MWPGKAGSLLQSVSSESAKGDGLAERWQSHAPQIVSGLIIALLLADVARFAAVPRTPHVQAPPMPAVSSSQRPRPRAELREIQRAHLFGAAPPSESQSIVAAQPDWVLNGVIATDDPHNGYAILAQKPQVGRLWRAGAELPGHERLDGVFRDHVLLEVNGTLQSLMLPRAVSGSAAGVVPVMAMGDNASNEVSANPARKRALLADDAAPPVSTPAERWFERLVPFTRSSQDGGSGFAMHVPGKKNRFGFQDGDVVTAINGHTVEDADAASQWMQQVSGSTVAFTVNRGGQSETFDVDIGD